MNSKKVLIIGAGFAGLSAAKRLNNSKYQVTLIDKRNHHLFQPLLYQVATAGLTPSQIAYPIRQLFTNSKNIQVVLDRVEKIDRQTKTVKTQGGEYFYDYLIIASGAETNYFGNSWQKYAPSLKTVLDATKIRRNILYAFEKAELEKDVKKRQELLTFVLVGGGPTGVEMAGAIAELAKLTMAKDFKNIKAEDAKVYLIEGGERILKTFPERLSLSAQKKLKEMGVEVILNHMVKDIRQDTVLLEDETIHSANIIWTAGVQASPVMKWLDLGDSQERVPVDDFCRFQEDSSIFIVGDAAKFEDKKFGGELPGVAPVALQQGDYVAKYLLAMDKGKKIKAFRYLDKGMLATVGRSFAVADVIGLSFKGFLAWILWAFVHILYLIGFRNRVFVMLDWFYSYLTFQKSSRLIVDEDSQ